MSRIVTPIRTILAVVGAIAVMPATAHLQRAMSPTRMVLTSAVSARDFDRRAVRAERDGNLRARSTVPLEVLPGHHVTRLDQLYRGVPVWGGEVVRETDGSGITVSILSNLYDGLDLDVEPRMPAASAKERIEKLGGAALGPDRIPKLVIYPSAVGVRLAYTERVASISDLRRFFIDANTGSLIDEYSERLSQGPVGTGTGVLGDTKKISTTYMGGVYVTEDALRPPVLRTYDLRGNFKKAVDWLNGIGLLYPADLASDADNVWTDGAVVDAHVYTGWAYDYYYKRMGRKGHSDNNSRILTLVHTVNRADITAYQKAGQLDEVANYYCNAFYMPDGIMMFGEGVTSPWTCGGRATTYWSAGLDVVAHEFTHGVVDYSSHLANTGEPRSLNEAFADMMAASIEFYYRGSRGNYTMAEDVTAGGNRSMSNPAAFGDIDHYSNRLPFVGHEYENSTIASHAFYLAIEGGTNRTSGRAVQGVGAANREQIEKSFYAGFVSLPSQATFGAARAKTIAAAQTLYGAGSAADRAITQAWDAVGVF